MNGGMSAIGTKRTSPGALHMSAIGVTADIRKVIALSARVSIQPEILEACW
jgi:hypothetical protein